ncbi:MAG: hypothetical protein IH843_06570, partial [Thaumarchaeota archaeon]|nr:hypothetical protein [Nitrososphaerota archaeon]
MIILILIGVFSGYVFLETNYSNTNAEATSSQVKSYKFKNGTGTVAVNPNSNLVYVTNTNGDTVSVLDGSTNNLVTMIEVGKKPFGIGVNSETNML